MGDIVITFETIYDFLRKEKTTEELQTLKPNFFDDVLTYLKQKEELLEKKQKENDLFVVGERERLSNELKNIKRVLKELYERRERKIIDMALNKSKTQTNLIDTSTLLREENQYYEELTQTLNKYRQGILNNMLSLKMPNFEKKEETEIELSFTGRIDQFIAPNLKIYGPYKDKETAKIPISVAEVLIEKGKATTALTSSQNQKEEAHQPPQTPQTKKDAAKTETTSFPATHLSPPPED